MLQKNLIQLQKLGSRIETLFQLYDSEMELWQKNVYRNWFYFKLKNSEVSTRILCFPVNIDNAVES